MTARVDAIGRLRTRTEAAVLDPLSEFAIEQIQKHTRWSLSASTILHALFLTWLILLWRPAPDVTPITEITFLEPSDLAAPSLAKSGPTGEDATEPGELKPGDQDLHFKRDTRSPELRFDSQSHNAIEDRLNARLAAIQGTNVAPSAGVAASAPTSLWGSSPATVSGSGTGGTSPVALKRGGEGTAPTLELTRGGHGVAPAMVATSAPAERAAEKPAQGGENTAKRTLAGVTLMGPIADRAILQHPTPVYPDWAKRDAVEGSVTLYFVVRADGTVKENILVQKTAGFEEFDENARAALAAWRFEPLTDGRAGEQWGNITFHFRLRGGD